MATGLVRRLEGASDVESDGECDGECEHHNIHARMRGPTILRYAGITISFSDYAIDQDIYRKKQISVILTRCGGYP